MADGESMDGAAAGERKLTGLGSVGAVDGAAPEGERCWSRRVYEGGATVSVRRVAELGRRETKMAGGVCVQAAACWRDWVCGGWRCGLASRLEKRKKKNKPGGLGAVWPCVGELMERNDEGRRWGCWGRL
uniref:Uncharacterized protein n=1 Tax=Populus alba TaxID=43335 RepID=A0A4V6A1C5_POPAL|nr:hypothetical protein D5086_0000289290 [Populus alba]